MSSEPQTFKLDELAERAGVSPRTVRYYVQRGLLPAPQFRGRDTAYGPEHLIRLKAIRALQKRFLPLDSIETELKQRSLGELERIGNGTDGPEPQYRVPVTPFPPSPPQWLRHEQWERIELAPGVELHLSDRADRNTRQRAEELLDAAKRLGLTGGAPR